MKNPSPQNVVHQIRIISLVALLYVGLHPLIQAQALLPAGSSGSITPPDSIVQITAEAQGLPQVAPDALPPFGTFWWAMPGGGGAAPMPCPPADSSVPIYQITDGQFLVDQTAGQVLTGSRATAQQPRSEQVATALEAQATTLVNLITQILSTAANQSLRTLARAMNLDVPTPGDGSGGGDGGWGPFTNNFSNFSFNREKLWLEITNVSNGTAYLNLHNATNRVYAIWSTTNLLVDWQVETEVWPTDTNCAPFSVPTLDRQNLFLRAEDWTDLTENGNTTPDWWLWRYFGTVNVADTNLDYSGSGETFAGDYTNSNAPTVFQFTGVEVTNNYVQSSLAAVQLNVAGTPYYVATLIDDNNLSNAVWHTYSGSTVMVNLGSVQGWHEVWIGLRGHADDPMSAVWQHKRLKLALTPPDLIITSTTSGTVDVSMIQLTGCSPEALSRISYDLTNAVGLVTNQQVFVLDQSFDANSREFTTTTFQGFDIPLANGLNNFTLHATDMAGNSATTNFGFVLDYSGKTNPPTVEITWPLDGTQISGDNFTVDGFVSDPTAIVTAQVTAANGTTNIFNGLVERNGKFWVEDLPLSSGTNTLMLTVTDAVGKTAVTNISVVQSTLVFTVNQVPDSMKLWQPTVGLTGTISDPSFAVWVNGVKGKNNGDGTWSADNVPVNKGGTASFTATAYGPNEQQPDNSFGN